jgi:signal transduction histidine kinase
LEGSPGRARVEIRYTALSFSAPEKVRFKYRMEGLDSAWLDAGAKRLVDYSFLPHGHYKFHVRACDDEGVWGDQEAGFDLDVPPHFWQTWWFVGASCVGGVAGISLIARRVEKKNTQRRLERAQQKHLVEMERARIAREFHDEIGSSLTHVIVLSELVKGDKTHPEEVEAHAAMISRTARKAVQGLGTIIWAANPSNDTLDSLAQYISQYSYDFCQATPVTCHLDLPTEVPPLPLTAEVRHNLFMIVKEALHNVVKHSKASTACVRLKLHPGSIELCVEDNGCGFMANAAPGGRRHGLANMRHRAEAIGATLQIISQPGAGCRVETRLMLPSTPGGQNTL